MYYNYIKVMAYKKNNSNNILIIILFIVLPIISMYNIFIDADKENVNLKVINGQLNYSNKQDSIITKLNNIIKHKQESYDSLNKINKQNKDSLIIYKQQLLNYKWIKYTTNKDTV